MNKAILVITVYKKPYSLINELKKEFPNYYVAFASLRGDENIPTVMNRLKNSGKIIAVPVFVYNGEEYKRVCDEVKGYGYNAAITSPLITCSADFKRAADIISRTPNDIYCVHSSKINLKALMQNELIWETGTDSDIINNMSGKVYIHPFMISFGHHAVKDISEKLQPQLKAQGIEAEVIKKGLADYKEIRKIFINKVKELEDEFS